MCACEHEIIEWQQRDQEMHVVGWACRWCVRELAADYHYATDCRRDFCGADPIAGEGTPVHLPPEQFHSEMDRIVQRAVHRSAVR
jgi:hypothetical protein